MTFVTFLYILLTVFAISIGQVLLKISASKFTYSVMGIFKGLISLQFIKAFIVFLIAAVMWIMVLKIMPLRQAYPYISLAFLIVPVLSYLFLGESIHWNTFVGALLISLGLYVSVYQ